MRYSIIIPVYNVEKYIHQCIDSILVQTFQDYEIILVDDGSPDICPAICDEYASNDKRIKVIHKPNGGLSDARNAGLNIAKGDYIIFIDSDDWWDDLDALNKINKNIEETNSDLIIFGMKKYFMRDSKISEVHIPQKYKNEKSNKTAMKYYMQNNIFIACACDKVISRNLIEKYKYRFVVGQYSEDIEWCCNLLLKEIKIDILEEAFYVYRQQVSTSISANVGTKNIDSIFNVINRFAIKTAPLPLLHFLANQYVLLITNFMRLTKENRKLYEGEIKSFWWLIQYNWYPYVKAVSKIKFLGFSIVKRILKFYYLYKRL